MIRTGVHKTANLSLHILPLYHLASQHSDVITKKTAISSTGNPPIGHDLRETDKPCGQTYTESIIGKYADEF